ncbi:BLUF domain-containing protein [Sphingomonas piscis]|uniref:BLUF domain-containing protein n=1 Tax=Sphingomonas piscis TaxID=2714943 RepID=A0A6G7YRS0_9SPHN|nr:BLUF domain-containing protein [Sphingomonas piscis]
MHQLVYISTARALPCARDLEQILSVSRVNNARDGVTGLLVSGGNRFLQALEGPTAKVVATYDRIQADTRHFACVVLTSRSIDQRVFGCWEMSYERARSTDATAIEEAVRQLTEGVHDKGLQAEFRTFAELNARRS